MEKLIIDTINELDSITEEAVKLFGGLTREQLNMKPSDNSWSIAQCLDHLIVTNSSYFPELRDIISGNQTPSMWKSIPLLPGFFGRVLKKSVGPDVSRKMKTAKAFEPSGAELPGDIVKRFAENQKELSNLISSLHGKNIGNTKVTSPAAKFISYSLNDMMRIITLHEERHIQQAIRTGRELGILN